MQVRPSHEHGALREVLRQKGFAIKGEFTCAGFDTFGPFKLIGGLKKGHPDEKDLEDARAFAKGLLE
jgi:flavodoxin